MEDRKELGLSSNLHKTFNMQSKLDVSGIDKMMKNSLATENIGLKYDRVFNTGIDRAMKNAMVVENIGKKYAGIFDSGISETIRNIDMGHIKALDGATAMLAETAGIIKKLNYRNNIESYFGMAKSMKMDYAGIIAKTNYASAISGLTELSGALEAIRNSPIFELSSSMKAWQASVKIMPNDFSDSYNSIITESMRSFSSIITDMDRNVVDFSSIKSFNISELIPELSSMNTSEFDEELEREIDLQEVKAIVISKVEDINLTIREESNRIILAINKLVEAVIENNTKGGLMNNVISGVLTTIIATFIISIFTSLNPYAPSNADIKHTIKVTKQVVRTMEADKDVYNVIRIVAKDGLEVRRLSKMKSGTKYYLDFGDLVKVEHKNRNWAKISYTNAFTDEIEIGWVLTRYIKRLD